MRRLEKFLFVYSIIAVTSLFISFGAFSPIPLNLISVALILPSLFYFWIKLTAPEATGAAKWSFRFILTIIILSGLGIFGYYLAQIPTPKTKEITMVVTPSPTGSPEATGAATPHRESIIGFLTDTPSPIPLQLFTAKAGVKQINVYKSPATSAQKIATLDGTQTYLYLVKKDGWYEVAISESEIGWVSATQIQEVQ